MLLPKLYRFALKRLVGPFLVDNELSLDDFEVRLRAKELLLKNLVLDVTALNSFLELDGMEITQAKVAMCQLSFNETPTLQLFNVLLVIKPGKGSSSKPTDLASGEEEDGEKFPPSSVSEGMGFLETWVDKITATLQLQANEVEIRIECESGEVIKLEMAKALSRNLTETRYRQIELHDLTVWVGDGGLANPVCLATLPHVLIQIPRPGSGDLPPIALFVKSIAAELGPKSMLLLQAFYCEFIKATAPAEDGDEEEEENGEEVERRKKTLTPRFSIDLEQVTLDLVPDLDNSGVVQIGFSGVRIDNQRGSVHRLSCVTWAGADLQLVLLRTDDTEPDLVFEFEQRHVTLQADVTITTSLQLSTLNLLVEAFSPPAPPPSTLPVGSKPASGFSLDATGTCRVVLRGQKDEVIVELHTAKMDESFGVSIESGVVWMNEAEAERPVFFLERFIRAQMDSTTSTLSVDNELEDDEDGEADISLQASKFEAEALQLPGATVVNVVLGGISTPANLEIALYQRFLAVFATVGTETADPATPSTLIVRSSCRTGRLLLGQAQEAMEISFEELTTFTLGERTVVQAKHFALSEFLSNGTQVPLCYASPHASSGNMQQQAGAFLGLITQVSPLHSLLCTQLSNVIFRVEPQSEGFARAAVVFAPSAAATLPEQPPIVTSTAVECMLVNCVFDVFPSESPFEEKDSRYRPLSRAMLCCGELHVTANLVAQAVSSRFDLTSRDAQLYLAHHSERDVHEYKLEAANGMSYTNDEYAVKLGFVRVGQWQSTLLFLRFDAETTELEIEMQDGKLMTCPDSFKTLTELLQHLSLPRDLASSPSSSIDLQANSSLSASDLRKHLATAPDSALSASQLKQRYETAVHLTPFVIEDYYTFASLPNVDVAASAASARHANKSLPLDDWILCDEDDEFKPNSSHKRAQPSPILPATSMRKAPPTSAFTSDVDDEDEDEDDKDIMRNSIMFATVTKMGPSIPASFKPERETIQLIDRADIDSGARRGIEGYKHLHASMMHIVQDIEARDKETLDLVNNESEMYRSALLAGSPTLWQPGQALQDDSRSSSGSSVSGENEEEVTMDGKYYEDNMDQVKIINHHFPVPNFPQPGSFSPPAAALAAKRIGEDYNLGPPPSASSPRGEFRFILRNGNMTWCLFGGRDFVEGGEEEAVPVAISAAITTTMRQSLLVIDDHFSRTAHSSTVATLFPQSAAASRRNKSQRDVSNALECVAKGMSLVVDSFAENGGRMSVCFAVHDFEVRDEIKSSPFKQMLHYWDVVNEPRCTGADMLRISVEIGSQDGYSIKAASLPLRLKLHQDSLDLLQQFNASPAATTVAGDSEKPSPPVEFRAFDFRALKMKIDFYPKQVQLAKLREGKYTELVCLFNYEGMEVGLKRALFRNVTGAGELVSLVINLWAEDVYNKQLFNLLAGVSPGLANIATDMANIVLLPVQVLHTYGAAPAASEVVRQSGKLAKTMFVEGIGMSNRMATGALNILDDSRPRRVPRTMEEGIAMAGQAMAERAKNTQHTIIAVPLSTLRKEGTSGAVKSVIRAIPIAVLQPFLGVGEAFEAITVGAKHSLKPGDYFQETTKWKRY
ncbi:hypothetical protein BASA81_002377 [Batrachochytrium salamandrivorans]|nr:hypothetical protein BASA81_002377 [Batrachochytrium salamandrivorans]